MGKRVYGIVKGITSWDKAVQKLKFEFKINNERQRLTAYKRLRKIKKKSIFKNSSF